MGTMSAVSFLGVLLLLLLNYLLILFPGLSCHIQDFTFLLERGFSSYEVIIPRQLGTRSGDPKVASQVSYLLQMEGEKHAVHLQVKKLLLSRHLRLFSFTEWGARLEDQPHIPDDCSYEGYVEGFRDSQVTLNTCFGGLRGILDMNGNHYQVEPLKNSTTFEHLLYRLKEEVTTNWTCGLTDEEVARQSAHSQIPEVLSKIDFSESYIHLKYVELMLVMDHKRYLTRFSNMTQVIVDCLTLSGIADTYFKTLKMHVQLIAIEVWNDKNKIDEDGDSLLHVLNLFSFYKKNILFPRILMDWTHLFVGKYFEDAGGWAWISGACNSYKGSSVSSLPWEVDLYYALAFVHEMAHGFGILHDKEFCVCSAERCLMDVFMGGRTFSNCSFDSYFNFVTQKGKCLYNIPDMVYKIEKCGNKVVEPGEDCDCGSKEECRKDRCCLPTCKFKQRAQCNSGLCCKHCHFQPSGKVCRPKRTECDLDEFCNGTTNLCPNDFYKQDGTPCDYNKTGLCYHNGCHSHLRQCRRLFGNNAHNGPPGCYVQINRGDRFGNCGYTDIKYKQCKPQDIMCGRVQCVNISDIPSMPDHTSIVQTLLGNVICWGTDYHASMATIKLPDVGEVKDGTPCGKGLICINKSCQSTSLLNYDCVPEKCNSQGVCNNRRNCHCDFGWAPPFCTEPGYGGSIDSGPPSKWMWKMILFRSLEAFNFSYPISFVFIFLLIWYNYLVKKRKFLVKET
ncbi:disintegrin and metalloproteinase domain-containing protein 30-like [Gracilinanus agilis]|uniref:disintegrin and metalloproteinase domain-containing protein 30-like n=1 Tax=Gracilinanus agilis TaxID=191870 RepID=UPI001CFE747E|nr:disintegrin and metalloproteinase domain-containing protein 30-like [Gracilinanus agilis]